jgi:hypothetical protein
MPRDIDERKKRAALRKLRRAALLAAAGTGPALSDWETRFLADVDARIETYGAAFADTSKGGAEDVLSNLQRQKLHEIDRKTRGKGRKPFGAKSGFQKKPPPADDPPADEDPPPRPSGPPKLTLIQGGAKKA